MMTISLHFHTKGHGYDAAVPLESSRILVGCQVQGVRNGIRVLGGSWVVVNGVISRVIILISHIRGPI